MRAEIVAQDALAVALHERRRGPKAYRPPSLDAIQAGAVPLLRVRDLAALTGLSAQKIRDDIACGELQTRRGLRATDRRRMILVTCHDALRYLCSLGVIRCP